jgi:hypothetical protein
LVAVGSGCWPSAAMSCMERLPDRYDTASAGLCPAFCPTLRARSSKIGRSLVATFESSGIHGYSLVRLFYRGCRSAAWQDAELLSSRRDYRLISISAQLSQSPAVCLADYQPDPQRLQVHQVRGLNPAMIPSCRQVAPSRRESAGH